MRVHPVCVALDLETTGLHPEQDAIIEVGAVKFTGDRVLDTFSSLVAPGMPLPYRIQRLTGITPAELRSAPTFAAVAPRLRTFLGDHTLVGHNVPFDVAFLRRAGIAQRNPLLDTYELASALLPSLTNYTLGSVSEALGVTPETAHRALADARMTYGVFTALLARLDALNDGVLEALASLPTGRDWTPSVLVRAQLRERGLSVARPTRAEASPVAPASPFASLLGAQIGRSLGMNPAVLSMAVAAETPPTTASTSPADQPEIQALLAASQPSRPSAPRERIATWAREGGPLLVEGDGTETCILDALVPLLMWSAATGERVLVAAMDTESVERLTQVLIPTALAQVAAVGEDVSSLSVAFLAEPEAYLCTHRWLDGAREADHADLSRDVVRGLAKLVLWAPTTRSGWRGEVSLTGLEAQAWDRARHGAEYLDRVDQCVYQRSGYCFSARAQAAAEEARILVTTHTALASALSGAPSLLSVPERVLVLDAHFFEEELRRVRTTTLDRQDLLATLDTLATTIAAAGAEGATEKAGIKGGQGQGASRRSGLLHLAAQQLEAAGQTVRERAWFDEVRTTRAAAERFFAATTALLAEAADQPSENKRGDEPVEHRVLRLDGQARQLSAWEGVSAAWADLERRLGAVVALAREVAGGLQKASTSGAQPSHVLARVAGDLWGCAWRLDRLCQAAARALGAAEAENEVAWLRVPYLQPEAGNSGAKRSHGQSHGKSHGTPDSKSEDKPTRAQTGANEGGEAVRVPTLQAAPITVGDVLAAEYQGGRGLALASPAFSVAGEFEHVRGIFGLPGETPAVPCQPDYSDQTLLALPSDVPEPNAPHFQQHLETALISLARALDGRLVAIFPSHAALRASYAGIRRALERNDIQVLAQGQDGSARQLWRTFHSEPRTVLLGAGIFWGGREQRTQPPTCIVVARLPFPAMSDPLLAARAAQWDDPQNQYVVPQVALKTRQALNGLAWSHTRRNAVVLFDRRVQTRGYGPTILSSLPRCTQHSDPIARLTERIADWVEPAPRG